MLGRCFDQQLFHYGIQKMEEYGIIPAVNPSNLTAKSLLNLCIQQDQSESSKPDAYSFYLALFFIVISLSLRLLLNFRGIIIQVCMPTLEHWVSTYRQKPLFPAVTYSLQGFYVCQIRSLASVLLITARLILTL